MVCRSRRQKCHGHGSAALRHYRALRSRARLIKMMRKQWRPMKFLTKRSRKHVQISSIQYSFDATTGEGKWGSCGTPVSIHRLEKNSPPSNLIHPNVLPIYFHDFSNCVTVCSKKGTEFHKWLQELEPVATYPIDDLKNSQTVSSIPFSFRKMFEGIFRGLLYIHESGYVVEDLSENNLCVVGETIKFWKFGLKEVSELRRQNFVNIRAILLKVVAKLVSECPEDMKDLLDILESSSPTDLDDKILRHMALSSPSQRVFGVTQILEMRGYSKENQEKWDTVACKFFEELGMEGWDEKYEAKIAGRVREVYLFHQDKNPYKTRVAGSMTEEGVVQQFFLFLRNLAYHIGEKKKGTEKWSDEHVDAVLFWAFGKEIILFNKLLKDVGLELNVEREDFISRSSDSDSDEDFI